MPGFSAEQSRAVADEFESNHFDPTGGLYYKGNREQRAGVVKFQSRDVLYGKGALSLSVKQFCQPDNEDCSERAEVWMRKDLHAPYEEPVWYAFSIKLAKPEVSAPPL